jgi:hypothetical protein
MKCDIWLAVSRSVLVYISTAVLGQTQSATMCKVIPVGPLHQARQFHSATQLGTGKVLIIGGQQSEVVTQISDHKSISSPPVARIKSLVLSSAEIYDPANKKFREIHGLNRARAQHKAVLRRNGDVLVIGGRDQNGVNVREIEIFSAYSESFKITGLLPDGVGVAAVAEKDSEHFWVFTNSVKVWLCTEKSCDPDKSSLHTARQNFTATPYGGQVVIAGGFNDGDSACLGDPVTMPGHKYYKCPTELFPSGESLPKIEGSYWHTATLSHAASKEVVVFRGGATNGYAFQLLKGKTLASMPDATLGRDFSMSASVGSGYVLILDGTVCERESSNLNISCSPNGLMNAGRPAYRRDTELLDVQRGTIMRGPDTLDFHHYGTATTIGRNGNDVLVVGGSSDSDIEGGYVPSISGAELFECRPSQRAKTDSGRE